MIPKDKAPVAARLSNWLTVQAAEVAGDVARFKRASAEAHTAYMMAARRLVDVRGECRYGEWAPFVEAAGLTTRKAADMMKLARAGMTPERLTECGGVRGALEFLREAAAGAVSAAGDALEGEGQQSATVADFEVPDSATAQAPVGAAEGAVQADTAVPVPAPVSGPPAPSGGLPVAPGSLWQRRRALGLCGQCGKVESAKSRCPSCTGARAVADAGERGDARIGRKLARRIREAAARGAGLRLSPDDVAGLVADEGEAFRARLGKAGRKR